MIRGDVRERVVTVVLASVWAVACDATPDRGSDASGLAAQSESADAAIDSSPPSSNRDSCLDRAVTWDVLGQLKSPQYAILPGGGFEIRPWIWTMPEANGGSDADGSDDVDIPGGYVLGEPSCVSALPPCGTSKFCLTDVCNALAHPDVQEAISNSPAEFGTATLLAGGSVLRIRLGDAEIRVGAANDELPPGIDQLKHVLMSATVQRVSACTGEPSCDGANMVLASSPPETKGCAGYFPLGRTYACFNDCAQADACLCSFWELVYGRPVVGPCDGLATCR